MRRNRTRAKWSGAKRLHKNVRFDAQTFRMIWLRIDGFMKEMGLGFGALDVIRTPQGEYVFLEVNLVGEWGMLERDLDFPIADAIAEELLR